jgi:hypothetical protein
MSASSRRGDRNEAVKEKVQGEEEKEGAANLTPGTHNR